MYYRPQGYRYSQGMKLPSNYGGSAFQSNEIYSDEEQKEEKAPPSSLETQEAQANPDEEKSEKREKPASLLSGLHQGSLFGGRIGSEELLIIALIFLLSDAEGSDDVIWLLLLLLFIK